MYQTGIESHCGSHDEQELAQGLFAEYRHGCRGWQRRSLPVMIRTTYDRSIQILTAREGSFPHEYILANSSPAILRHHLVCCIQSPFTATLIHSSSRPISRKHSSAAMFVICARGVSAVLGVAASIRPLSPMYRVNPPVITPRYPRLTMLTKEASQRRASGSSSNNK